MSDPTRDTHAATFHVDDLQPLKSDPLASDLPKHPHDPDHINPKISSDIQYWAHQFRVSGQLLHEAIRTHGTSVVKIRAALAHHQVNLT